MTIQNEDAPLAIGIDVGATKISAALVDKDGAVLIERRTMTLVNDGADAVVGRMARLARELQQTAPERIAGIGVGTPGYVDPSRGVVAYAVNMNWRDVSLVEMLERQLQSDIPVHVDNDANVLALGEYYYGAAKNCGDLVYVSIGSGLGSGFLVDHRLVHGVEFRAAELGHLPLDLEGRACPCGLRGCAETVVSGPGILATARELLRERKSSLRRVSQLTPEDVLSAAQEGDTMAIDAFAFTGQWLGHALAICATLLNPSRIIIGGGMGLAAFDYLVPGALQEMRRRCIAGSITSLEIVRSQVHSSAVGASSLVWHSAN